MSNAYITNTADGTVSVIDTSTDTVKTGSGYPITVGTSPVGVAASYDGKKVYTANQGSNSVSVIDTSTDTVSKTINVGTTTTGIAITPDGKKAYVTNISSGTGRVSVIDTSTDTVSANITVGTLPIGIAVTPNGNKVYVANGTGGTVSVIDTSTDTVSATITVAGTTHTLTGVAITPDSSTVYVTDNQATGKVYVIATSTDTVSTTITTGNGLEGISITPDGSKVYVADTGESKVKVIATATNTVSATLTVGNSPEAFGIFIQPFTTNGDFMNKFRNGTMDIWQRGSSSITVTTSGAYTADGWIVVPTGASCSAQQTASNPRSGALSTYSLLMTGAASVTDILVKQRIESFIAQQLEGQQVTVQAQIYNNTGGSITPTLTVKHAGSADNWSSPTTDVNAVSLQACANGAWTQVGYTFAASSSSGNGLEITFDFGNNFSTTSKKVQITELDIRATGAATGLISTPPAPELRPIQVELALCQRYFETSYDLGTAPGTVTTNGVELLRSPSTNLDFDIRYKVPKRTPSGTVTAYSPNSGTSGKIYDVTGAADITANTSFQGTNSIVIYNDAATANHAYEVHWTSSAEL